MASGLHFARGQLEKTGWKAGSGLGKEESGITEAIKVKIKTDTKGVGHDAGEEFTFRWWDHAFNKAASNIEVAANDEGISVKMAEESGPLSKKRPNTQKMLDSKSLLYGRFVRSSTVMTNGKEEKRQSTPRDEETSDSSDDEDMDKSTKHTDEDIFKLCGGRTAHKGARHGLKANGKLQRVEQQEAELLKRMRERLLKERQKEADLGVRHKSSALVNRSAGAKMDSDVDSGSDKCFKKVVDLKVEKDGRKVDSESDERESGDCQDDASAMKKKRKKQQSNDSDKKDHVVVDFECDKEEKLTACFDDGKGEVLRTSKKLKKRKRDRGTRDESDSKGKGVEGGRKLKADTRMDLRCENVDIDQNENRKTKKSKEKNNDLGGNNSEDSSRCKKAKKLKKKRIIDEFSNCDSVGKSMKKSEKSKKDKNIVLGENSDLKDSGEMETCEKKSKKSRKRKPGEVSMDDETKSKMKRNELNTENELVLECEDVMSKNVDNSLKCGQGNQESDVRKKSKKSKKSKKER